MACQEPKWPLRWPVRGPSGRSSALSGPKWPNKWPVIPMGRQALVLSYINRYPYCACVGRPLSCRSWPACDLHKVFDTITRNRTNRCCRSSFRLTKYNIIKGNQHKKHPKTYTILGLRPPPCIVRGVRGVTNIGAPGGAKRSVPCYLGYCNSIRGNHGTLLFHKTTWRKQPATTNHNVTQQHHTIIIIYSIEYTMHKRYYLQHSTFRIH